MNSPHGHLLSILASLATLIAFQSTNFAQGFLGHEIAVYGKTYGYSNEHLGPSPFLIDVVLVGPDPEVEPKTIDLEGDSKAAIRGFDFDAFTIEMDLATLKGFRSGSANFNGFVFEDANGTLPDFKSVTIDKSVSTYTSDILVTPNSIWVNDEGHIVGTNEFQRLKVSFADTYSAPELSLHSSESGDMILEASTQLGARYQFEQSQDLVTFKAIDQTFTAIAPHWAIFIKPDSSHMHYRLRMLEAQSIPLQTDFESENEGWTVESNSSETQWQRGRPASDGLTNAASGTQAWGTNLSDEFRPDTDTILRSPLVDLSKHTSEAALSFRYVIDTPMDEGGQLRFVDEKGQILHTHLEPITGTKSSWTPYRLVLPESLQNKKFIIEFRFLSNGDDEVGAGWFIDDVLVL